MFQKRWDRNKQRKIEKRIGGNKRRDEQELITYSRYTISESSCRNVCSKHIHISQNTPDNHAAHTSSERRKTYSLTSLHSGASDADILRYRVVVFADFLPCW
jgi:hypothetical protein